MKVKPNFMKEEKTPKSEKERLTKWWEGRILKPKSAKINVKKPKYDSVVVDLDTLDDNQTITIVKGNLSIICTKRTISAWLDNQKEKLHEEL